MNRSDNDDEIDLGLTLGSTSHCIQTNLNNSSGAGVNANSRMDMGFAASDPLSELVWSPNNGLSLKCADSSLVINKPFLLWNVGPSTQYSLGVREKPNGDGNTFGTKILTLSQPLFNMDGKFGDKTALLRSSRSNPIPELGASHGRRDVAGTSRIEDAGAIVAVHEEQNKDGFCGSERDQIADIVDSGKRTGQNSLENEVEEQFSQTLIRRNNERGETGVHASSSNLMGLSVAVQSKPEATKDSESPVCAPFKDTSVTEEAQRNISKVPFLAQPLNKLEFSGENDLDRMPEKETRSLGETKILQENSIPMETPPTNNGICVYLDKGKAKALSDGDVNCRPSNDADDSHESVESCNSGMKRPNRDQDDIIVESKRMKQSFGSTSIFGLDSSFMGWISNMVKGLSDSTKPEFSPLPLALPCPSDVPVKYDQENSLQSGSEKVSKGFQTMFQSMYSRNSKKAVNVGKQEDSVDREGKELIVAGKTTFEDLRRPSDRSIDNTCVDVSDKAVNPKSGTDFASTSNAYEIGFMENKDSNMLVCAADDTDLPAPIPASTIPENCNPTSLWITRLYTKSPKLEEPSNRIQDISIKLPRQNTGGCINDGLAVEIRDVSAPENGTSESATNANANDEVFLSSKQSSILPTHKFKNPEAMASVFARRLDALKNSLPSEKKSFLSCRFTCYFCGKSGHDLQSCPDVTETEKEELIAKVSSMEIVKQSCICIRCFQSDHWAISCLSLSSSKRPRLGSSPSYRFGNVESPSKASASTETLKRLGTSENNVKDGQKFPICVYTDDQSKVGSNEMFQVVRKLRLTRADVLRWMNSGVSLSHLNGFFLRLRVGKLEAELDGTGYYVACIIGDVREYLGRKSDKSILVNVGGIKSSVGSQYISNHDFLEDEIDVWWRRMVKTDGKIPSLDELNSKLQDRTTLGF